MRVDDKGSRNRLYGGKPSPGPSFTEKPQSQRRPPVGSNFEVMEPGETNS